MSLKNKKEGVYISLSIPNDLHDFIKCLAKRTGTTKTNLINICILLQKEELENMLKGKGNE